MSAVEPSGDQATTDRLPDGLGNQPALAALHVHPVEVEVDAVAGIAGVDDGVAVSAPGAEAVDGIVIDGQPTDVVVEAVVAADAVVADQIELLALVAAHIADRDQVARSRRAVDFPHFV